MATLTKDAGKDASTIAPATNDQPHVNMSTTKKAGTAEDSQPSTTGFKLSRALSFRSGNLSPGVAASSPTGDSCPIDGPKPTVYSSPGISPVLAQFSSSRIRKQIIAGGASTEWRGPMGTAARRRLSLREEATVREVFDLFDEDQKGAISRDEVAIVIQSLLDEEVPKSDLAGMVDLIETENDNAILISFEAFRSHLEYVMGQKATIDAGFDIDDALNDDSSNSTTMPCSPPARSRKGSVFGKVAGGKILTAKESLQLNHLREKWMKLGTVIALAAQANGELSYRGGLAGAFNYRKKQLNREVKKRMHMKHQDVVTHFQLRRISVDARDIPYDELQRDYFDTRGVWDWLFGWFAKKDSKAIINGNNHEETSKKQGPAKEEETRPFWGPWHPDSMWRQIWNVLIMAIVAVQAIYVPFMFAFQPVIESFAWKVLEYTVDLIFIFDILITFNTGICDDETIATDDEWSLQSLPWGKSKKHHIVTDRWKIAYNYLLGWFIIDFIASVPTELVIHIILTSGSSSSPSSSGAEALSLAKGLRLPRLLRLLRMARLTRLFRLARGKFARELTYFYHYSTHANWLKLCRLIFAILLLCHYMACLLYITSSGLWFRLEDCDGVPCSEASTAMQYITSFYTIFLLINGAETEPRSDEERVFAIFAILVGSIMVATIFGNVSIIIMNFTANQYAYRKKMESLYENMNCLSLPEGLRARIVDYYDQMWHNYRSLDGRVAMFVPELNKTLASEIVLYMRTAMVMKVPFFAQCTPGIVKEFVMNLDTDVFLRGDYIVHKGVPGKEMFLISRGKCEVTNNFIRRETTAATVTENKISSDSNANESLDSSNFSRGVSISEEKPMEEDNANIPAAKDWRDKISQHTSGQAKIAPLDERGGSKACQKKNEQNRHPRFKKGVINNKEIDSLVAVEKVLHVLPRGAFFGEVALVTNARRGCNVRARTFCEIQILRREVFNEILSRFPDEKRVVKALLLRRCNQEEIKHVIDVRPSCIALHQPFMASSGINNGSPSPAVIQDVTSRLVDLEKDLASLLRHAPSDTGGAETENDSDNNDKDNDK